MLKATFWLWLKEIIRLGFQVGQVEDKDQGSG
jgi:hypothetical protein